MGTVQKLVLNQRLNCHCGCNEWHIWLDGDTIDYLECVSCHATHELTEGEIVLELE